VQLQGAVDRLAKQKAGGHEVGCKLLNILEAESLGTGSHEGDLRMTDVRATRELQSLFIGPIIWLSVGGRSFWGMQSITLPVDGWRVDEGGGNEGKERNEAL
jgi:hypothetical protein